MRVLTNSTMKYNDKVQSMPAMNAFNATGEVLSTPMELQDVQGFLSGNLNVDRVSGVYGRLCPEHLRAVFSHQSSVEDKYSIS